MSWKFNSVYSFLFPSPSSLSYNQYNYFNEFFIDCKLQNSKLQPWQWNSIYLPSSNRNSSIELGKFSFFFHCNLKKCGAWKACATILIRIRLIRLSLKSIMEWLVNLWMSLRKCITIFRHKSKKKRFKNQINIRS